MHAIKDSERTGCRCVGEDSVLSVGSSWIRISVHYSMCKLASLYTHMQHVQKRNWSWKPFCMLPCHSRPEERQIVYERVPPPLPWETEAWRIIVFQASNGHLRLVPIAVSINNYRRVANDLLGREAVQICRALTDISFPGKRTLLTGAPPLTRPTVKLLPNSIYEFVKKGVTLFPLITSRNNFSWNIQSYIDKHNYLYEFNQGMEAKTHLCTFQSLLTETIHLYSKNSKPIGW